MNAKELLIHLQSKGIFLFLDDGKLKSKSKKGAITPELASGIKQHKQELITLLKAATESKKIPLADRSLPLKASFAQMRLWFIDQLEGETPEYYLHFAMQINGKLDVALAKQAFTQITQRHESLRTVFRLEDGEPVQEVHEEFEFQLLCQDFTALDTQQQKQAVSQEIDADSRQLYDLSQDLMLRARWLLLDATPGQEQGVLLFNLHHIAGDGWSIGILVKEFIHYYEALLSGTDTPLPPLPVQYADYAQWQRDWLQGDVLQRQSDYWVQQLTGLPATHGLPLDNPRPTRRGHLGHTFRHRLPQGLSRELESLAVAQGVTPFMLFHAILALVFARHSNRDDVVIGTTVANRLMAELEPLIGFFVNTLVLRTRSDFTDFTAYLQHVREVNLDAQAHQDIPFEQLVEQLQVPRSVQYTPLFQILFSMNTNEVQELRLPGLELTPLSGEEEAAQFDMNIGAQVTPEGIEMSWNYDVSLFEADTIARLHDHFVRLCEAVVLHPAQMPGAQMLSEREIQQLTALQPGADTPLPSGRVHSAAEAQAQRTPDAPAVAFEDSHLSYDTLNQRANQVAHYLIQAGVTPGVRVGIYLEPGLSMLTAVLAVLKAGGAFVPIEPGYPESRVEFMLEDAGTELVLTEREQMTSLMYDDVRLVLLDDAFHQRLYGRLSHENPQVDIHQTDTAWVIYTSGSTGQPKGVAVSHGAALCYLQWAVEYYLDDQVNSAVVSTSLSFDATLTSLLCPLFRGGCVHVLPQGDDLLNGLWLALSGLTASVFKLTPSHLRGLLSVARHQDAAVVNTPHRLVLGGEALSRDLLAQTREYLPQVLIDNEYGPTEAVVGCCVYRIRPDDDLPGGDMVPVGLPRDNTRLYVLSRQGALQPFGCEGELYIGGPGLASDYLNRAELTAERFVPDPFDATPGARMYRTGDRVRYLPDGNLLFLGRVDEQVKLRGYRIEPGEIEHLLMAEQQVSSALVMVRGEADDARLVGYVLPADSSTDEGRLSSHLGQRLQAQLPAYMVPSAWVFLSEWPLTANGKTDRNALPDPDNTTGQGEYVPPQGDTETTLVRIWSALLKVDEERLSVTANFFELGGHSLLAVRLMGEIRSELSVDLPVREIFEHTCIRELALVINTSESASSLPAITAQTQPNGKLATSFAQQRLWFTDQMAGGNPEYNLPLAIKVSGAFDSSAAETAMQQIIERHEPLRTVFQMQGETPVQIIRQNVEFSLAVEDLSHLPEAEQEVQVRHRIIQHAQNIFDLSTDLMVRAAWLLLNKRKDEERGVLLFNMHHIASDGWSMGILVNEFVTLYSALQKGEKAELPELPIQYRDYAQWQQNWLQGEVIDAQANYWLEQLADLPAVHNLPLKQPRPSQRLHKGGILSTQMDKQTGKALQQLAKEKGMTSFMLLHGCLALLLARYSNNDDIVIGTPVANRLQRELASLIGFFVNTLVLRTNTAYESLDAYFEHVKTINLDAQANQDIPFEQLVDLLNAPRSAQYSPLYQISFTMDNNEETELSLPGLELQAMGLMGEVGSRFDLSIAADVSEDGIQINWRYDSELFESSWIANLAKHYETIIKAVLKEPGSPIEQLPLLSEPEQQYLIRELNPAIQVSNFDSVQLLHERFEGQVKLTPDEPALICDGEQLSYSELNTKANRLARYLIEEYQLKPTQLVGICIGRTPTLLISMLAVLKAGGAYVPMDPEYPIERLAFMTRDCDLELLLTHHHELGQSLSGNLKVLAPELSLINDLKAYSAEDLTLSRLTAEQLAYVIYTSGSTGQPKGVAVSHGAALCYLQWAVEYYLDDQVNSAVVSTSLSFDATLTSLLCPLFRGGCVHVLPQGDDLLNGLWLALSGLTASVFKLTPSHLRGLLSVARHQDAAVVNTPHRLVLGGEALSRDLLAQTREYLPQVLIDNEYGPTEAVVGCCVYRIRPDDDLPGGDMVPVGLPRDNTRLYVLSRQGALQPFGCEGELYIGGPGLASDYLNRAELTAERFVPDPFDATPGARMYRTGDRVRYLPDGNLLFLGRVDEQVKLRGYRIEPGEIEHLLMAEQQVSSALVMVRGEADDARLVGYVLPADSSTDEGRLSSQLGQCLQAQLPAYMVPSAWVFLSEWPLTANGKTDRNALPDPDNTTGQGEYVPPQGDTETTLVRIWSALLKVDEERLSVTANFYELGGHSLLAVRLMMEIRSELDVEVQVRDIFDNSTIRALAEAISNSKATILRPQVKPLPKRTGKLTTSFAQQRLWFIDQMESGSPEYNMPMALNIKGNFDVLAAERAMQLIVERHEPLRTVFEMGNEQPLQMIREDVQFTLHQTDLSHIREPEQGIEVQQRLLLDAQGVFDLSSDLMLRASWLQLNRQPGEEQGVLLLNMHHIASDGWSMGILMQEFVTLYKAVLTDTQAELPALPVQYADYAQWQRDWLQGEVLAAQTRYWQAQLADLPVVHNLPLEATRPAVKGHHGSLLSAPLSKELSGALQRLANDQDMSLFMLLHAALALLLSRHSNSDDIVIGTPVANRLQKELTPLIGFFVNTLVMRTNTAHSDLNSYFRHVRQVNLDAQAHQDIPFEQLVELLKVPRNVQHTPLFQIMFSMEIDESSLVELSNLTVDFMSRSKVASKFDLDIDARVSDEGIVMSWLYDTELFSHTTVETLQGHLETLLSAMVATPDATLSQLSMLSQEEQKYLLEELNPLTPPPTATPLLHQLFETQANRTPDAIALVSGQEQLTYQQLNHNATQLAHYLAEHRQIQPGQRVGICLPRCADLLVSILAVLKAGAAWVPLDPQYPQQRLDFMVQDSGLSALLCAEDISLNRDTLRPVILSPHFWSELDGTPSDNLNRELTDTTLPAYVIYTSGSTGKPKGVVVAHREIAEHLQNAVDYYRLTPDDHILQVASASFDTFIEQTLGGLLSGASVCLAPSSLLDVRQFFTLLIQQRITVTDLSPAFFSQLLNAASQARWADTQLRCIVVGGEALSPGVVRQWHRAHVSGCQLYNAYGPTEAVITTTVRPVTEVDEVQVRIGRGFGRRRLYVLDTNGRLAPFGSVGELVIGGPVLAEGYLHQPALTEERFVPDPFSTADNARMYRTGDLVRYLPDGELVFAGRVDEQVKLRGFRIEPGEIELHIQQLEYISNAAVVVAEINQRPQLVAFFEPTAESISSPETDIKRQIRHDLSLSLPDYMVPGSFQQLSEWPLTVNGKIDRARLSVDDALLTADEKEDKPQPETLTQQQLHRVWCELLNLNSSEIGIHDNFFQLGGDSILSIQVVSRAQRLGLVINVRQLFEFPTISTLAHELDNRSQSSEAALAEQQPITGEIGLLPIQRHFLLQQPGNPHHFNQSLLLSAPNSLTDPDLADIAEQLLIRHDALRLQFSQETARFTPFDKALLQSMVQHIDCDSSDEERIQQTCHEVQQSLNIHTGPVMKLVRIRTPEQQYLFWVIHHFVVDGVSWRILVADFMTLWQQLKAQQPLTLAAKTGSLKDWFETLTTFAASPEFAAQKTYWLNQSDQVTGLPNLTPESAITGIRQHSVSWTKTQSKALLEDLSESLNIAPQILFLVCCANAINRFFGVASLSYLLEGHGRDTLGGQLNFSDTVGWFTSTWPVTLNTGQTSIQEQLIEVKNLLSTTPNNGIGYGLLNDTLHAQRENLLRWPDVVFNYLGNFQQELAQLGEFKFISEHAGGNVPQNFLSQEKLVLNSMVKDGELHLVLEYLDGYLSKQQITKLVNSIAEEVLALPQQLHSTTPLLANSDYPLAQVSQSDLQALDANELEDLYLATPMQEGMLFHSNLDAGAYNTQLSFEITDVDLGHLKAAWQCILARHVALRTAFEHLDGKLHQKVMRAPRLTFKETDIRYLNAQQKDAFFEDYRITDKQQGFDVTQAPLMRFSFLRFEDNKYIVLWSHHHALLDGWCLPALLAEVDDVYAQLLTHGAVSKISEAQPVSYKSYVAWLARQDREKARHFWQEYLADSHNAIAINVGNKPSDNAATTETQFSNGLTQGILKLAKQSQTTPGVVIQAAWAILNARYTRQERVVLGVVDSGRPAELPGIEDMLGLFINTVPVVFDLNQCKQLPAWLQMLHKQQMTVSQYSYLPLTEIQSYSAVDELFNTLLVFENYPLDAEALSASQQQLNIEKLRGYEETTYPLTLVVFPEQQFRVRLESLPGGLGEVQLRSLLEQFQTLLGAMVKSPETPPMQLPILGEEQYIWLTEEVNRTRQSLPVPALIHRGFEQQVLNKPGKLALRFEDISLTYEEVNSRANQVAAWLVAQNVQPGNFVSIMLDRGVDMIIAMLAVAKSGAAWVAIDPLYPMGRIAQILTDTDTKHLISHTSLNAKIQNFGSELLCLDNFDYEQYSAENLSDIPLPDSGEALAYAIFTSGSTGNPKGVLGTHIGVVNMIRAQQQQFVVDDQSRVLHYASIGFDASISEWMMALLSGASLYIASEIQRHSVSDLSEFLQKQRITHATIPPAVLANLELRDDYALRALIVAGESCPQQLVDRWAGKYGMFNAYGPSENSVCTSIAKLTKGEALNIGKPIANTSCYVIASEAAADNLTNSVLPTGALGELYISGTGLALGYLKQPDITGQAFVSNPFSNDPCARLYKSGDLVRRLADGSLQYAGRVDKQIKIRGQRIEPGEIEQRLIQHPQVASALVALADVGLQEEQLSAYIIRDSIGPETNAQLFEILQQQLSESLPDYMLPKAWAVLDHWPLNNSGKIATDKLPQPTMQGLTQKFEAPATATEQRLAKIWAELLKLDVATVSAGSHFFQLGGHSLLVASMVAKIRTEFSLELDVKTLIESADIRALGKVIDSKIAIKFVQEKQEQVTIKSEGLL